MDPWLGKGGWYLISRYHSLYACTMKKLLLSLLLFPSILFANDSLTIRKMADHILLNGSAYENLRFLCKQIGPRLSGSKNASRAIEATADMLKKAGADTVYLQPCMVPKWERGKKESGWVKVNGIKRKLALTALGNSEGTGPGGIYGNVIMVSSLDELHSKKELVNGKIVFIDIRMNQTRARTFSSYGEASGGRVRGASIAARYGAKAALVRSLTTAIDNLPHTGVVIYNDSFPKIPAVAISTLDADYLSGKLRKGMNMEAFIQTDCRNMGETLSYNVIGEIKGTHYPDQILTVGGHLDSWDLAEGAHDDGAGCVQSIQVIETIKALGIKPKRTIRAVMFMNEENGGKGAQAYLKHAKDRHEKHLFAMESDAGGFSPRGFSLDMPTGQMEKVLKWKHLFDDYLVYDFYPGGGGADIGPLKSIGTALVGLSPDSQRYFDLHHAPNDVFEAVSKRELEFGAINMTALIWLVSEYGL